MFQTTMRAARRHFWWASLGAALLSACGGGGDDPVAREQAQARPSYSVGGTITLSVPVAPGSSDLFGLSLDGGISAEAFDEPPFANPVFWNADGTQGTFTFARKLFSRETYNVSVTAPVAGYTCSVASGGSGTIDRSDITDVVVTCNLIPRYDVSVSVSGLKSGNSVVIQNLGAANQVTATADGTYTFPFKQYDNTNYSVTIPTQTARANCTVPQPGGVFTAGMPPIQVQCGVK